MPLNSFPAACAGCLAFVMAGCASSPSRVAQATPADYAALSCAELAKESKRLVRDNARKQEYLLPEGRRDAAAARQGAKERLKIIARVASEKGC
jgi:hypothetical protein